MFRAKFDRVISIGEQCGCAMYLRKHNLRFASYPLDWIGGPDFGSRVDLITRRFADFLEREDLVFTEATPDLKHDVWVNKVTGFHFVHDFDHGKAMDEAFPEVKKKYDRRIERFFRHIDAARRVLLVYWSRDKMVPADELVPAQQRLSRYFGKEIYLLVIQHDEGMTASRREALSEHVLRYVVDMHVGNSYIQPMADESVSDPIFSKIRCVGKRKVLVRRALARIVSAFIPGRKRRRAVREKLAGQM